jgi:hypothetical protein
MFRLRRGRRQLREALAHFAKPGVPANRMASTDAVWQPA